MARQFNQSSNAYANALRIEQTLQQSLSLLPDDTKSENSDSNYLQDPFADDIEPIDSKTVPKPSNKARLSKVDTAISLLSGFSAEFQNAAYETRLQMALNSSQNLNNKNEKNLEQQGATAGGDIEGNKSFLAKINSLRKTVDYESYRRDRDDIGKNTTGDKREQMRRDSRHLQSAAAISNSALTSELECIDNNLMSGFWHMMEDETMINGFPLTSHGYNIYNDKRIDWLRRTNELPTRKTYARNKCEQWMKNSTIDATPNLSAPEGPNTNANTV